MIFTKKVLFLLAFYVFCSCAALCANDTVILYRPSNFGALDDIRCFLRIEDENGNDITYTQKCWANYSWIDMPRRRHPYQQSYFLTGGMAMHIHLVSGTYTFYLYTPVEEQHPLYLGALHIPTEGEWQSEPFVYDTNDKQLRVIFVSPTANQNGFYTGGWHIDYRAPRFYMYTKPYRKE